MLCEWGTIFGECRRCLLQRSEALDEYRTLKSLDKKLADDLFDRIYK